MGSRAWVGSHGSNCELSAGQSSVDCGIHRTSGLDPEAFAALHNSAKRGDIVGVKGHPGKSKMGELSIFPRELQVLSPCLHMLPTGNSGLKDQVLPLPQLHAEALLFLRILTRVICVCYDESVSTDA